jgi:hypothetical protein
MKGLIYPLCPSRGNTMSHSRQGLVLSENVIRDQGSAGLYADTRAPWVKPDVRYPVQP